MVTETEFSKLESQALELRRDLDREADKPEYRYHVFNVLVMKALSLVIRLLIRILRDK